MDLASLANIGMAGVPSMAPGTPQDPSVGVAHSKASKAPMPDITPSSTQDNKIPCNIARKNEIHNCLANWLLWGSELISSVLCPFSDKACGAVAEAWCQITRRLVQMLLLRRQALQQRRPMQYSNLD